MKPEDCPKLDKCSKVEMIRDKDLLDFQYAEAIRTVCANCSEGLQECPKLPDCEKLEEIRKLDPEKYDIQGLIGDICWLCDKKTVPIREDRKD